MKLMREYLEKNFLLLFFSFVLIAFYNYIAFKNIYSLAYVPDETWFYRTAIQSYINDTFRNNLFHVNDFGYGGLWWSVYTIFIHMFHSMIDYTFLLSQDGLLNRTEFLSFIREDLTQLYPLIAMRFINLFLLNIVFIIIIYKSIQQNILFISGLVVLLLTPMLYWSGKMASPELTAITIEFIGVYYFFQKRYFLAIFLLIFSLGIKPTVLPVIVVVGLFLLYQLYKTNSLNLSYLMKLFICAICGFIVSNPIVLLHPKTYVKTLLSFKNLFSLKEYGVFDNIEDQIQHIVFKENLYMWEGTMYGSLEYWSFPIIILCCLFLYSFVFSQKKESPFFVMLVFVFYVLFMLKQPFHNWYFFSVIILLPFLFYDLSQTFYSKIVLILGVVCLIFVNMSKIESELAIKRTFLANIKQFQEVHTCLDQEISNKHLAIKRLFNSSEIGLSLKSIPSGEYFNYHDTFVYNKGFGGGDLFVIGNRAETFFPHLKSNFFYHNSEHITQGRCGFVEYYYIKDEI